MKKKHLLLLVAVLVTFAGVLISCGDDAPILYGFGTSSVTIEEGHDGYLVCTNYDTYHQEFYSEDEEVATVEHMGRGNLRIHGVKQGVTKIVAKYKKHKESVIVTVTK